jgi:hypothetical protein
MMNRIIKIFNKSNLFWINLEISLFSKKKDFLEGASPHLMNALNNPYIEANKKKKFNRSFNFTIAQVFLHPKANVIAPLIPSMKQLNKKDIEKLGMKKEDFFYCLNIRPNKQYNIKSLQNDIKALYTIVRDSSLALGYGWDMKYTLNIDSNDNLIVTQEIGFLKISYLLLERINNFLSNPKSDLLCFIDNSIDKIIPDLIKLSKKEKDKKIKEKIKSISELLE